MKQVSHVCDLCSFISRGSRATLGAAPLIYPRYRLMLVNGQETGAARNAPPPAAAAAAATITSAGEQDYCWVHSNEGVAYRTPTG
jgi:hypothetical protein